MHFPNHIDAYIAKQLKNGTIIGPFTENPFGKRAKFSPLNSREKRESNERRIIMDLSYPPFGSVNDGINKDVYRGNDVILKLPNIFSLVEKVQKIGTKAKLFKRDLTGAFKQIKVCPGDIHLLGFMHNQLFYFDVTLPQGLTNSCYICQRVTDMIMYIYAKHGFLGTNYLDDMGDAQHENIAQQAYLTLGHVLQKVGAKEAMSKATPPASRMTFLGTLIDANKMRIEVMPERLIEIRQELAQWLTKTHTTVHQSQSMVGKLSFCAVAVRAGRVLFSRVLNVLRANHGNKQLVQITDEMRSDIIWWYTNINNFNGVSVIPSQIWVGPNKIFSTDACLTGIGGWSDGQYFASEVPQYYSSWLKLHINQLETLAVMIGLKLWAYKANGMSILVQCDNQVAVQIINTGRTQDVFSQAILCEICHQCAMNDCQIKAVYIPTNDNRISDSLSRAHLSNYYWKKFHKITRGWSKCRIYINASHFKFTNNW